MSRSIILLISISCLAFAALTAMAGSVRVAAAAGPVTQGKMTALDSRQLEREIQALNWNQFRSVVEAIPQLKAEIEKYGPAGWQYVKARYKTHAWRRSVERLKDADRQQLAKLLQAARKAR